MKSLTEFNSKEMIGTHSAEKRLEHVKKYLKLRKKIDLLEIKKNKIIKEMRQLRCGFSVFEFHYIAEDSRKRLGVEK